MFGGGPELWDRRRVARECGVEPNTVVTYTWRSRRKIAKGQTLSPGDFPLPMRIGNRVWWVPAEVEAYVAAKAPYVRAEQWLPVEVRRLKPGDVIDHAGALYHVQMIRAGATSGDVEVRVSKRRLARTGTWVKFRAGTKVRRLPARG